MKRSYPHQILSIFSLSSANLLFLLVFESLPLQSKQVHLGCIYRLRLVTVLHLNPIHKSFGRQNVFWYVNRSWNSQHTREKNYSGSDPVLSMEGRLFKDRHPQAAQRSLDLTKKAYTIAEGLKYFIALIPTCSLLSLFSLFSSDFALSMLILILINVENATKSIKKLYEKVTSMTQLIEVFFF